MKKLILILTIFFFSYSHSQEYLQWKDRTVAPIVFEVNDLSSKDIYQRIRSWVDEYYISPEEVLMVDKTDKIRIRGISVEAFTVRSLGMTFKYNLSHNLIVDIKEGKYRLTYEPIDILTFNNVPVSWDLNYYYKKNGKLKDQGKLMPDSFNNYLKSLSISIRNAVVGAKNDDW